MAKNKFSFQKFVYTFLVILLLWYAFTTSIQPAEIITGIIVSLLISYISVMNFNCCSATLLKPKNFLYFIQYFFVFMKALIIANFDVARRVLSPKLDINPGIIKINTKLESKFAKMVLANSITLTPGTLSIDVIDDELFIHWIDVSTEDPQQMFDEIAAPFEKILLKIYK